MCPFNKFALVLPFALLSALPSGAREIHLSPGGSDSADGGESRPVATFPRALALAETARRQDPSAPITLWVHKGTYAQADEILLDRRLAGTAQASLTIQAWGKGTPRLCGGVTVTGWARTNFNGRADVYVADLSPQRITARVSLFFLNGKKMIPARYPNEDPGHPYSGGWAYVPGKVFGMYTEVPGEPLDAVPLAAQDFHDWSNPGEGLVCIFPRYNWWNVVIPVSSCLKTNRLLKLSKAMPYAARPRDRYCLLGLREELDAPGEWYQDVLAQKLYFIPPAGTDLRTAATSVPLAPAIIHVRGLNRVTIRGLELSAGNGGVSAENCEALAVVGCRIHDIGFFGGQGVNIRSGYGCEVRDCDLWAIGGHAVFASGGDDATMRPSGNRISNNYIHHCGQVNRHGIGVMIYGLGTTVAHNLIHDTPRCAIFHGGRLDTIEFNRIHHTNLEMEDTGAIYGGGYIGCAGTVVRFNHISDSIGFGHDAAGTYQFHHFACGIYIDEAGGGESVYGNLVERSQIGAMHLHNARFNSISNNIFVCNAGLRGTSQQFSMQGWNNAPGGYFVRVRQKAIQKEYDALMAKNPAWKKMPSLAVSPAAPFLPDGSMMQGNRLERNIFYYPDQPESPYLSASQLNTNFNFFGSNVIWAGSATQAFVRVNGKMVSFQAWQASGADRGSVAADPLFVNPAAGDWRLRPDSPAFQTGFAPIPFGRIGLQPSPDRKEWPVREADGARNHPGWLR